MSFVLSLHEVVSYVITVKMDPKWGSTRKHGNATIMDPVVPLGVIMRQNNMRGSLG